MQRKDKEVDFRGWEAYHKMIPLVSIIVPIYNSEKTLKTCLDSILRQKYRNIELILINDGSTDSSKFICEKYTKRKNVKLYNTINKGQSSARNTGIEFCSGEFIMFVDSDDSIPATSLSSLVSDDEFIVGNFVKVFNGLKIKSKNEKVITENRVLSLADIKDYVQLYLTKPHLHSMLTFCWGKLYRADIIKKNSIWFNSLLRYDEDVDFNFKYLLYVTSLRYVSDVVYHYNYFPYLKRYNWKDYENWTKVIESIAHYTTKNLGMYYATSSIIVMLKSKDAELTRYIVWNKLFQSSLNAYTPESGDSILIPILAKMKLVRVIMFVCRMKNIINSIKRWL